ncbi:MAG: competence protein ComEA [Patescibacteria group bacterium]|nr:competence protein ComEA [Patescibacteria group bacterium]
MIEVIQRFKYPVEIILIFLSISITCITFFLYSKETETVHLANLEATDVETIQKETITIDLAGAVEKPNVYTIPSNTTLHEVISMAGGLSKDAAHDYISRTFNMATTLSDKEKIYIPFKEEIEQGLIDQNVQILSETTTTETANSSGISINTASESELDSLPGVGPITAKKIADNRPYESIEELISKKAVNSTTFEKIKELISL